MKNLKLILILTISFFTTGLWAKQIRSEVARQVAETQISSRIQLSNNRIPELRLIFIKTTGSKIVNAPVEVIYYVFNAEDKGFVIVSGDDIAVPVLGYSESGIFDPNNLPPNFTYYMDCLAKEINEAIEKNIPQSEKNRAQWDAYLTGNTFSLRTASASGRSAEKTAAATLMYHCGIGAKMDYTASGSGAYASDIALALITNFNYDQNMQYKQRSYYSNTDWEKFLRMDIDAGRPVFYAGSNSSSSHAFICDGYNNSGYFHFNWGWGGYHDGYYVTTALNSGSGGVGTYYDGQAILINIKPNAGGEKSHEIKINDQTNISVSKTALDRGELFSVNVPVRNRGLFNFNGLVGIAIVDAGDNVLSVIGQNSINMNPGWGHSSFNINCAIPASTMPGNCRIRVVYKSNDNTQWSIATGTPGYTDALNLTITANSPFTHGITVNSNMTSSVIAVNRGQMFTVAGGYVNSGTDAITGDFGIALVNNSDEILEIIGITVSNYTLLSNFSFASTSANCGISSAITPGNYKIRAVFRPINEGWAIIHGKSGSSITDILNITVYNTIMTDNSFVLLSTNHIASPNPINQFTPFSVQVRVFNLPSAATPFIGELELGLYNSEGLLREVIGTEKVVLPNNQVSSNFTFNTSSINSPIGTYNMVLYQRSADGVRKKVNNNGTIINELSVTVIGIPRSR